MALKTFLIYFVTCLICLELVKTLEINVNGTLLPCEKKDKYDLNPPYHIIEDCLRKIRLIVNIMNSGKTPEELKYIYVKEVQDPKTGVKMRLLNPIVVQLRQDQVVLAYPFKYLSAVNGKVSEIVVNYENTRNFSGCDDTSSINPTCGIKVDKGITVPYSEGFCCFCPEKLVKQKQERGGQDCSIDIVPAGVEKHKYKASAHCLQFSNIWFSVSALSDPIIIHNLHLQVFNQKHLSNGSSLWVSLTHGESFELGPKNPSQYDDNKTIVATFMTASLKNGTTLISAENNRLLIPQPMIGIDMDKLPPVIKNGAKDYLLLSKSIIAPKGDECDKAGVSYEAFMKQKNRCKIAKNRCLKNQPLDFWEADEEKRKSGKRGSYLLQNYGQPYNDPVLIDQETKEHSLALEYHESHLTVLTVEFKADDIIALTVGREAQIITVITAISEEKILFTVSILNNGLLEASLSVRAVKCEYGVPDSDNVTHVVPPQLIEKYILSSTPGKILLVEKFFCTIVVTSKLYGAIARRQVIIKPKNRCVCNWHCHCVCLGESVVCKSMSEEEFHEAGFKGSLPVLTAKPPPRPWIIQHPVVAVFTFFLILLILGGIKAIFGIMGCNKIGHYGLNNRIYRPGHIKSYVEPELRFMDVVYDKEGYPIHPDLKYRTKAIPFELICGLNVLFFFIWPFILLYDFCTGKRKGDTQHENTVVMYSIGSGDETSPSGSGAEDVDKIWIKPTIDAKQIKVQDKKQENFPSSLKKFPVTEKSPNDLKQKPIVTKKWSSGIPKPMSSRRVRDIKTTPASSKKIPKFNKTSKEMKKKHMDDKSSEHHPVAGRGTMNRSPDLRRSISDSYLSSASSESPSPPPVLKWRKGAIRAAAFPVND